MLCCVWTLSWKWSSTQDTELMVLVGLQFPSQFLRLGLKEISKLRCDFVKFMEWNSRLYHFSVPFFKLVGLIFVDNGTYHQVGGSSSNNYGPKPWNGDPSLLKGKWLTAFNDHVLLVYGSQASGGSSPSLTRQVQAWRDKSKLATTSLGLLFTLPNSVVSRIVILDFELFLDFQGLDQPLMIDFTGSTIVDLIY